MKYKTFFLSFLALSFLAASLPSAADIYDSATPRPVTAYRGLPAETLEKLGGAEGLKTVVDEFYAIVSRDNRVNLLANGASPSMRSAQRTALIQTLMGTPSIAQGTRESGVNLLTVTQYNAMVEDLYLAMDNARVPYHVANLVLGSIGPYTPALVSAYVAATPSTAPIARVQVGPVERLRE